MGKRRRAIEDGVATWDDDPAPAGLGTLQSGVAPRR
jgi:hypothetical protein